MEDLVVAVPNDEARVNVTFGGQNGDLPDPVFYDSTDGDIRAMVTEAIRDGSIPGIPRQTGHTRVLGGAPA